jgi:hypothetical protein
MSSYKILKDRYFEKIIYEETFGIYYNSEIYELQYEKEWMEKAVGFEMPFTTNFCNYHINCFRKMRGNYEVTFEDVSKEMREEIIYFAKLNKKIELIKEQEKQQEVISNEKVKNEYNKFLTLQRKRILWNKFSDYKYSGVIKDFEFKEQNITLTTTQQPKIEVLSFNEKEEGVNNNE